MANVTVSYLKEEHSVVEDINGIVITEGYCVTNIGPGRSFLKDALNASGIPPWGDTYPGENFLFCLRRVPTPWAGTSNTDAKVICTFAPPDLANPLFPIARFHGSSIDTVTNYDANGLPIIVRYTPTGGSAFPAQVGQVRGTRGLGYLTFDFYATGDGSTYYTYLDALNSSNFRGGAPFTWQCKEVETDPIVYRGRSRVHMGFAYDSEGHIHTAAYRLLGGIIPADIAPIAIPKQITAGNGYANVRVNGLRDFNAIGIPLSTF